MDHRRPSGKTARLPEQKKHRTNAGSPQWAAKRATKTIAHRSSGTGPVSPPPDHCRLHRSQILLCLAMPPHRVVPWARHRFIISARGRLIPKELPNGNTIRSIAQFSEKVYKFFHIPAVSKFCPVPRAKKEERTHPLLPGKTLFCDFLREAHQDRRDLGARGVRLRAQESVRTLDQPRPTAQFIAGTAHALTLALSVKRDRFSSSVTDSMPCAAA